MESPKFTAADYTVCWICAIDPELDAARAMLDITHPDLPQPPGDDNSYCLGQIGQHNVAIACLPLGEIGTSAASKVATRMLTTFTSMRFGLMVGVGGGVPSEVNDIRLGDVVVSMPTGVHSGVVQWDLGRALTGGDLQRTGSLNRPPEVIMTALRKLRSTHRMKGSKILEYVENVMEAYPYLAGSLQPRTDDVLFDADYDHADTRKQCSECCVPRRAIFREPRQSPYASGPTVHYGLIASGNKVVKDASLRDRISRELGDVLCFEMEAGGLMNHFRCIVIRGISDYADSHKKKDWQPYAAATAAAFAKELLLSIQGNEVNQIRTLNEAVREIANSMKNSIKATELERHQVEEDQKCLRALYTSKYELHKNRNPTKVDGTCEWFRTHDHYVEWLKSEKSKLLWVTADPGCGKSVLCKWLAEQELASSGSRTTCYFFFKEDNPEQSSLTKALSALLHQLLKRKRSLLKYARAEFDEKGEEYSNNVDSLWDILKKATADPEAGKIFCILDALDECEENEMKSLVDGLRHLFTYNCGEGGERDLKLVITSRPHTNVERSFRELLGKQPSISLSGEREVVEVGKDIALVIGVRAKEIASKIGLDDSVRSKIEQALLGADVNHRTYLWLKLTVEAILSHPDVNTERKILKAIRTLPTSVYEAYEMILNKGPGSEESKAPGSKESRAEAKKLLHIIVSASRPLSLKEIEIALAVEAKKKTYDDLDLEGSELFFSRVKNLCGLLVTVVDSHVYLIHQTAKEFLVRREDQGGELGQVGWAHSLDPKQSNLVLAQACIWYLLFEVFESQPLLIRSDDDMFEVQKHVDAYLGKHAFFEYAALSWHVHLRGAHVEESSPILEPALRLCDTRTQRFLSWFWIYWLSTDLCHCPPGFTDLMICSIVGIAPLAALVLKRNSVDPSAVHPELGLSALMLAVYGGHKEVVALLLNQKGISGGEVEEYCGRTPVWWAAGHGHVEIVRLLLEQDDVDPEAADTKFGGTPLLEAASSGHSQVVKVLLGSKRVKPDIGNFTGRTPLSFAAEAGHEELVQMLLDEGADPNSVDLRYGRTPLVWAARNGHAKAAELLLKQKNVCPNLKERHHGRAPLSWAAERGHKAVVQLLLDCADVDPNTLSNTGLTPLAYAAQAGDDSVVELLFSSLKLDPDTKGKGPGRTPLSLAAQYGHESIVQRLLKNPKVDPDSRCASGRTPLSWAAGEGRTAILPRLIENPRVDAHCKDTEFGRTPLSWAAGRGFREATELLLKISGTDLNSRDHRGQTPLLWAAKGGHDHIVEVLLAWGNVELNSRDIEYGKTSLSWAASRGHEGVVGTLLDQQGVEIDSRCNSGRTPLSWAAGNGHEAVTCLLLQHHGINIDSRDNCKQNAKDWAAAGGHEAIVKKLKTHRKETPPPSYAESITSQPAKRARLDV